MYRLIREDWVKTEDGEERPTSQSFHNTDDGAMSVFFADEMAAAGASVADLIQTFPPFSRAVTFTAGELRALGQTVERDKIEEFPGHGAVRHPDKDRRPQGVRSKMSLKAEWFKE
ncbi:hypothetical protein SK571_21015 [Lentzea sp. BCCO 10_0798]|uniref:Uncharacterized protein n=1 Tax=Lentzea kristufekii TaxID=3095430 RepID=A0ABU4TUB4_9PSEU|nr:hypothetical protein [Lentzea sp. BCCO 10_0798]MDX8051880.1 hypothetical protein [Lentzea sp. BCCO 10_0798]